jgi:hypothetical protein
LMARASSSAARLPNAAASCTARCP